MTIRPKRLFYDGNPSFRIVLFVILMITLTVKAGLFIITTVLNKLVKVYNTDLRWRSNNLRRIAWKKGKVGVDLIDDGNH